MTRPDRPSRLAEPPGRQRLRHDHEPCETGAKIPKFPAAPAATRSSGRHLPGHRIFSPSAGPTDSRKFFQGHAKGSWKSAATHVSRGQGRHRRQAPAEPPARPCNPRRIPQTRRPASCPSSTPTPSR
ncbi:hypothetical protein WQ53_15685 [Pseudoxanthomonas suwonensis]|uniref:Uncharacterized protein n=1 Tax=Pseudoxanthomonas suwonensis TaxID=314722 RepID=A0A0E3Z3D6_9GAMM|nr:hypothetical protein WQ53_15685 [Pseudoxanthomonas suwonensis]